MIEPVRSENFVRIVLPGDLDAPRVSEMRPQLRGLVADGYREFLFDFGNAKFMCSAGLGLLVEIYNAVIKDGGSLVVANLNNHLTQLLTDTKLLPLFTTQKACDSTRLSALEAVQSHMSQELLLLSYLSTITSNVLQADITEDICVLTLEGVLRSLDCKRGFLLLVAEGADGRILRVAASEGFDPDVCGTVEEMLLGPNTLEQLCLESMEAVHISSANMKGAPASPLLAATGVRDGIMSPMVGRSRPLGLLLIEGPADAPSFFQQSTPMVQVFSNVCGLALEKQSLVEDIQYKNAQLSKTLSELNKTQSALMESGKLAALGAISRGLGHTLNNKLVPIMGYTQMIRMQIPADSDLSRKVKIIETSATDIKKIIDNMRAVARKEELKFGSHDLREIIDSALFMLDYLIKEERILVERSYAVQDCTVQVDRDRMIQAFLAIFQRLPVAFNQAERRNLRVEVSRGENNVEVRIIDNGRSVSPEELEHILDPFTRETIPSEIDRFNLSIANGIMKDHKGAMSVQPGQAAGLCVTMQVPLLQVKF